MWGSSRRGACRRAQVVRGFGARQLETRPPLAQRGNTADAPPRDREAPSPTTTIASRSRAIRDDGGMGFIPVGDLMRQLVLALGAALVVGNLAVVVREKVRPGGADRPKPNMKLIALNLVIGCVLTLWGVSSLLAAG